MSSGFPLDDHDGTEPKEKTKADLSDIPSWMNEHLYEDITNRKGTLYEEVDDSEGEDSSTTPPPPPPLPERPGDLKLPESLHLQKLSNSIRQTLEERKKLGETHKGHPKLRIIKSKKIKEVGRIMIMGTGKTQVANRTDL